MFGNTKCSIVLFEVSLPNHHTYSKEANVGRVYIDILIHQLERTLATTFGHC